MECERTNAATTTRAVLRTDFNVLTGRWLNRTNLTMDLDSTESTTQRKEPYYVRRGIPVRHLATNYPSDSILMPMGPPSRAQDSCLIISTNNQAATAT